MERIPFPYFFDIDTYEASYFEGDMIEVEATSGTINVTSVEADVIQGTLYYSRAGWRDLCHYGWRPEWKRLFFA